MLSTIKSVKDYTGVDLYGFYNRIDVRNNLVQVLEQNDPGIDLTANAIDAEYEARAHIIRAQGIIESFVGRDEIDVDNPSDLLILDKMVAYQSAYMLENQEMIWQQIALTSQGQTDFIVNFNTNMHAPWIAPLAVIASKGLSWKRSRSFRTGKIFQFPKITKWRNI